MWTRCGSAKTRAPERRGTPSSGFFTWLVNLLHLDATLSSRLARTRSEPPRTPRRRSGSSASISKAIRSSAAGPKSLGHPGGTSQARSSICPRSEEHTSELQSQFHLVCRLLLEKKKNNIIKISYKKKKTKTKTS